MANLVQVNPLYVDILSNGESLISLGAVSEKLDPDTRALYKPIHFQEYNVDGDE